MHFQLFQNFRNILLAPLVYSLLEIRSVDLDMHGLALLVSGLVPHSLNV